VFFLPTCSRTELFRLKYNLDLRIGLDVKTILALEHPQGPKFPSQSQFRVGTYGSQVTKVSSWAEVQAAYSGKSFDIVLINYPIVQVLEFVKIKNNAVICILFTDMTMRDYSKELGGREDNLLDHIICMNQLSNYSCDELSATLQKLIRNDIFGIDKYLGSAPTVGSFPVKSTAHREELARELREFCELHKLGGSVQRRVNSIAEELIMNSLYDAPVAGGKAHYEDLRDQSFELQPDEYAILQIGFDAELVALGVCDPFGAFSRQKFFSYIKKVLHRDDIEDLIDSKKGGAGLGIFKIMYDANSLILNSQPRVKTELIALLESSEMIQDFDRMGRSVHYFEFNAPVEAGANTETLRR
jgi:hypothetical protein